MRPIGRDLLADVAPAPEPEFLLIELPPSVEGLARGWFKLLILTSFVYFSLHYTPLCSLN